MNTYHDSSIYAFVRKARDDYKTKTVKLADGLDFNQYENIQQIERFYNSVYASGNLDVLGREKPFYNIVKSRVNLAVRATDLDVKDVQVESDLSDGYERSFVLGKENRNWMREIGMSRLLNRMGYVRTKYGGVVVKKTEHGGNMEIHVVPWKDLITDQTDIEKGVIIERHFYTPAELMDMKGTWNNVEDVIKYTASDNKDEQDETNQSETPGSYIEIFEIHGDLPNAYLEIAQGKEPEEEDWYEYSKQVHILAGCDTYSDNEDGKRTEHGKTLYFAKNRKSPYKYLSWEKIDGRALGVGPVEDSFEAQIWTNDAKITEKRLMEFASMLIFQTTDKKIGKNVLTGMQPGEIVQLTDGKQLAPVNTISGSIPQFTNIIESWRNQVDRATSVFEANSGESLPSGTPYRLAALQNQEANSHFQYRMEEMGSFIEEIYSDWVMPYFEKKLSKGHKFAAEYTKDELDKLDEAYINHLVYKQMKDDTDQGILHTDPGLIEQERQRLKDKLSKTGNRRYMDVPEGYYKNLNAKVRVSITNEQRNKGVYLESLSSILQTIANMPQVLQMPQGKAIFNQIMEISGISPVTIEAAQGAGSAPGPAATIQSGAQGVPQPAVATPQTALPLTP